MAARKKAAKKTTTGKKTSATKIKTAVKKTTVKPAAEKKIAAKKKVSVSKVQKKYTLAAAIKAILEPSKKVKAAMVKLGFESFKACYATQNLAEAVAEAKLPKLLTRVKR